MGTFIVLEGVGGMGKSTQKELLIEYLQQIYGKEYVYSIDFPRYDVQPYGPVIRAYLSGAFGDPNSVSPHFAGMLYAQDRSGVSSLLRKLMEGENIIVSGRYVGSNLAYQGVKFGSPDRAEEYIHWQNDLEYRVLDAVKETLTIILHAPAQVSQGLIDLRHSELGTSDSARDGHEKDTGHVQKVIDLYVQLADRFPTWRAINCTTDDGRSLRESHVIFQDILTLIEPILPIKKNHPNYGVVNMTYSQSYGPHLM